MEKEVYILLHEVGGGMQYLDCWWSREAMLKDERLSQIKWSEENENEGYWNEPGHGRKVMVVVTVPLG